VPAAALPTIQLLPRFVGTRALGRAICQEQKALVLAALFSRCEGCNAAVFREIIKFERVLKAA